MTFKSLLFKPYLVILLLLSLSNILISQTTWIRKLDLNRYDGPTSLIQGDSDSFYFTHRDVNGSGGTVTQNLTKMSFFGEEIWSIKFENYPNHVFEGPTAKLPNDEIIVCFLFEDSLDSALRLYKVNSDGDILWTLNLPSLIHQEIDYAFRVYKIIPVSLDDIRLYFRMNSYWGYDSLWTKNGYISLDSTGVENHREYFETNGEYHWPYNIIPAHDNHFIKVYRPTFGQIDLILRYELLDSNLNQVWSYEIGPQDSGGGGPVCVDSGGNVYFTWNYDTTGNGSTSHQLPSIISLNKQGELRWKRHFGEDRGIPIFYDIKSMSGGRIIACGQEGNDILSGGNYRTGWIVCIDTLGVKLWERRYILDEASESGNNFNYEIESQDGDLILFGNLYNKEGGSDVYLLKTNHDGCLFEDCELYNFVSLKTSVEETIEDSEFISYIINSTNIIIVIPDSLIFHKIKYNLINVNGILIDSGVIIEGNTDINITHLVPGIYFINVYSDKLSKGSVIKYIKL